MAFTSQLTTIDFHGQPALCMNLAHSRAVVSQFGAQLLAWELNGVEQLYCSPLRMPEPGKPVRGGAPVIFPQFGARGALPFHGFARTQRWDLCGIQSSSERVCATLRLRANADTLALWPHAFTCELQITLTQRDIRLQWTVQNTGDAPFTFSCALHSYFRVGNLASAEVHGLQGLQFEDATQGGVVAVETDAVLRPQGYLDRIYRNAPNLLTLRSAHGTLEIYSEGFPDAVVWNPGQERAAQTADLPDADWDAFLCVESGAIHTPPTVAAGGEWVGAVTLRQAGV